MSKIIQFPKQEHTSSLFTGGFNFNIDEDSAKVYSIRFHRNAKMYFKTLNEYAELFGTVPYNYDQIPEDSEKGAWRLQGMTARLRTDIDGYKEEILGV